MFQIERITLTNFRSYYGIHVFEFPTAPGLYHLTGKNLVNPGLEGCACGKSSLLDAIFWCLYGRTTRGLKAGDVVTWGEKSCSVDVNLNVGGLRKGIERHQNPNILLMSEAMWPETTDVRTGNTTDQDAVNKYLRLSPEAFLYSVIMPQFGDAFFDLTPSAKLNVFSSIMDSEFWLDKSYAAGLQADQIKEQKIKLDRDAVRIEGQYEATEADIQKLSGLEKTFTDDQTKAIGKLEVSYKEAMAEAVQVGIKVREIENLLLKNEERLAKYKGADVCPTCKQAVPNPDLISIRRNQTDFEGKLQSYKWSHKTIKTKIDGLKKTIAEETAKANPYSKLITENKQALAKLEKDMTDAISHIAELDEKHYAVDFWVGGFKRIRLFIIEEALQQLELEVNNNLASLGLPDWRIGLDVERENKSGGVTKGFTVMITPPGVKEPIRYESYSGSETQRLRLAGNLGLANLIMEKAGLSNTIEFYDEPSAHMNPNGLIDLAEALAQRAQDHSKVIFMVDHHVVDFSGFAGTLTVTMGERGSRL